MENFNSYPYLKPRLLFSTSFKELMEKYQKYGSWMGIWDEDDLFDVDDLLLQDTTFIVGEPGEGKTRLLEVLVEKAAAEELNAARFDLRSRIASQTLEEAIVTSSGNERFDIDRTDNALICLDGLDEIPSSKFSESVQLISKYKKDHPGHKLIVTSRLHFFAKYESSFTSFSASYVMLLPLEREQQVEFLEKAGFSKTEINIIIQKFYKSGRDFILGTPRYLKYFVEWYKDNADAEGSISRAKIFNHFVDKALSTDDEKIAKKIAPLKRRTLEKLALVMEIAQTNSISHEEFVSFIDVFRSEAKQILFTALNDLEEFYNHGLIKDDGEKISFDNAELQEYLAACEIHRLENNSKAVFDLAVDAKQRMIHPRWYNTLSYVLELNPELLSEILDLQKPQPDLPTRPEDPETHKLIGGISADLLSEDVKNSIFRRVFDYYIESEIYMDFDVVTNIAFYATAESEEYVRSVAESLESQNVYKNLVSVAAVIGKMQYLGVLNYAAQAYWREHLKNYALTDDASVFASVLKRFAVHALEYFKDNSLIRDLRVLQSYPDELVRRAYESMCDEIDADDINSIQVFITGIKRDNSIEPRMALAHIKSRASLAFLLQAMIDDADFLKALLEYDSAFRKENNRLFHHLEEAFDPDLVNLAEAVLPKIFEIDSGYYMNRSQFADHLVKSIGRHDPTFFTFLLQWGLADEGRSIFDLQGHLARIMRPADVDAWSAGVDDVDNVNVRWHLFRVVVLASRFGNSEAASIEERAREAQPEMFVEYDRIRAESPSSSDDPRKSEFLNDLGTAEEERHPGLLADALNFFNRETDRRNFSDDEVQRLWQLTKDLILDVYNPADANFRITHADSDGSQTYTQSVFLEFFRRAVLFAHKTSQQVSEYRQKIVALMPYLLNEEADVCINLLGSLSPAETQDLITIYSNLSNDSVRYHPMNFVEAAAKLNIHEAVDLLNKFVDEVTFQTHVRNAAIEASEKLGPNSVRLEEIYQTYHDGDLKQLAKTADALLITNHSSHEAVLRLIGTVKASATEFVERYGATEFTLDPVEHELRSGETARPLQQLGDPQFIPDYLSLLEFSFELYKKGDTWHAYGYYIWRIVLGYFGRLKQDLSFKPLEDLERWVSEHSTLMGIGLFKEQMVPVRRDYAIAINKPRNFNEAIKKANKIEADDSIAISSSRQLVERVENAIRRRVIPWIETEAVKVLDETHAQKLIRVQLENALMKEGFSPGDLKNCHIIREPQGLDDKRPDFLVYHGFIGPVVIEIKLISNGDLTGTFEAKKSYASLETYIRQYEAEHAIFFVLDDKLTTNNGYVRRMKKISEAYTKILGVTVLGARLPRSKEV